MEGKASSLSKGMRRRQLRLPSSDDDEDAAAPPPQNPNPNPNAPLEISDDEDFVDVPDVLSPPSPPPCPQPDASDGHAGPIDTFLRPLGLRLRPEWLCSCLAGLAEARPGFEALDVAGKAKLCFERFLLSDINCCGVGVLPESVHSMHKAELAGPFVLQVDEIVNISSPLRGRYHAAAAGPKRCLKLSMTDGVQRVFGMEYRPIRELEVLAPAGLKIVIRNVQVCRGLLMLVPEVLEILGGFVEDLEAARQRLVEEVNKPPRGKRRQAQLTLSKRASLAAWPSSTANSGAHANNSISRVVDSHQPVSRVTTFETDAGGRIIEEIDDLHMGGNTNEEYAVPDITGNTVNGVAVHHTVDRIVAERPSAGNSPSTEPTAAFSTDVGDVHMIDELEHPQLLRGDKEIPFTYLASLLAKWTARDRTPAIQGKIKCFLTGVKGFQFKQRSTFELLVFVDDGSLISEVLIDHHVVQKGIGHSPEEVTAALSSSDKRTVTEMRDTMKKFQLFLAKFEGTMLVELNGNSHLPIALEMTQGCSSADVWLLLRRLRTSTASKNLQSHHLAPIDLSP